MLSIIKCPIPWVSNQQKIIAKIEWKGRTISLVSTGCLLLLKLSLQVLLGAQKAALLWHTSGQLHPLLLQLLQLYIYTSHTHHMSGQTSVIHFTSQIFHTAFHMVKQIYFQTQKIGISRIWHLEIIYVKLTWDATNSDTDILSVTEPTLPWLLLLSYANIPGIMAACVRSVVRFKWSDI